MTVPVLASKASSLVVGTGAYALVSWARDVTARSDQLKIAARTTLDLDIIIVLDFNFQTTKPLGQTVVNRGANEKKIKPQRPGPRDA